MQTAELEKWVAEVSQPHWVWYVKILSGNDTLATGAHQAGPYIPKDTVFKLFPGLTDDPEPNPRRAFDVSIDSHGDLSRSISAIWYNQKTRNEARFTGWGGSKSPLLDPEMTGSLTVFGFHKPPTGDVDQCRVWICRDVHEVDRITELVGPVEPGSGLLHDPRSDIPDLHPGGTAVAVERPWPRDWLSEFPAPKALSEYAAALVPVAADVDSRLLRRRDKEFEVFSELERAHLETVLQKGFGSVEEFVAAAHSATNRRKARSGRSLELQAMIILDEERIRYDYNPVIEEGKRPDFLFPSKTAYDDPTFPTADLHVLGAKTTCKDRWRQILNEADRVRQKHLLTLQEGVSENQHAEMERAGVALVVPRGLQRSYPKSVRSKLMTFAGFLTLVAD